MKIRQGAVGIVMLGSLFGCALADGVRIDSLPMYGQPEVERPDFLKKADEAFIEKATRGIGSREKASQAWFAEGNRLLREGHPDIAMHRYNQSWLLNPDNYQPYWGFARILLEQDRMDDAIRFFEKAETLIDDPYQKPALLSDMGSAYTYKGKHVRHYFSKANQKFSESTGLDPAYGNA